MATMSASACPAARRPQQHRLLPALERLGRELLAQGVEILAVGEIAEDLGKAAALVDARRDLLAPHMVLQLHA